MKPTRMIIDARSVADGNGPPARIPWLTGFLVCTFGWLLVGCDTVGGGRSSFGPIYQPSNIYRSTLTMPPQVRRVAVLPVTFQARDWGADAGRPEVEPILHGELSKTKVFEVVIVTPEQLLAWSGRAAWRADEVLPVDFFERARKSTGCDAVLFAHLRPYHAYRPMSIGWNLKLVETHTKGVLWAADELFDASQPAVIRAAEQYWDGHHDGSRPSAEAEAILNSPRRFSQYTLCALLATLPQR